MVRTRVELADVLSLLASETQTRSSFGLDLERARTGVYGASDPVRRKSAAEDELLAAAPAIRCVDALLAQESLRFVVGVDTLRRLAQRAKMPEGAAVVGVLRAYQPWASSWPEKGIVAVYEWMRARSRSLAPLDTGGETNVAQAFRAGKHKHARQRATTVLADAELALSAWVGRWNRPERHGSVAA